MSIDIIVPTYNRPNDIKKFISEITKQTYSDYKVYIIDDCSDKDISHLIPDNKHFYYERLSKNIGQTGARNIAIKKGNGDIIISLDDDAWFLDNSAFENIEKLFSNNNNTGCFLFNIEEPNQ